MTQYSSREPFNDDPKPWVIPNGYRYSYLNEGEAMFGGIAYQPRPEYTLTPTNPTNPILTEFRRLVRETGNGLYVTAWMFSGDLLEEWESYPLDQWHHAMDVLEKILSIYKEPKE